MPFPETKPDARQLQALAVGAEYAKAINELVAKVEPVAREWMNRSFPNAKIFENRVASLSNLMAALIYRSGEGDLPKFISTYTKKPAQDGGEG